MTTDHEISVSSEPQRSPLAKHPALLQVVCEIQSEGFSLTRWDTLLYAIDAALTVTGNGSYVRGQIDQHDAPLDSETIERFREDAAHQPAIAG